MLWQPPIMNKDAILATTIGLILGLLISGIFIFGPNLARALPKFKFPSLALPKTTSKTTPTPTPTLKEFSLSITAPLAEGIEPKKDVVVSGATAPGATVVIQGPMDADVVIAGEDGAYAGKVTAVEGKNDMFVTAYAEKKQATQRITIYYTEENF